MIMEPVKALIIDDEIEFIDSLRAVLGRRNILVTTASDGPSALGILSKASFDVVVLDIKMPGMDGLDVLAEVRRLAPRLPVILMTGHLSEQTDELRRRAFSLLIKPYTIAELMQAIELAIKAESPSKTS
jgi:DNA-binding NtrC family response regulator